MPVDEAAPDEGQRWQWENPARGATLSPMGRRPATRAVVEIFVALLESPTWTQADLARRLGVRTETLRQRIAELQAAGVPLEREEEHPHVYWSVRKGWLPGGVALDGDEVRLALRMLARLARSSGRDRLLSKLLRLTPDATPPLANRAREEAEDALVLVEDAAARRLALRFEYLSGSRNERAWRHATVHRIEYGPHARFVATCHRDGELKWFRVDAVLRAATDEGEPSRVRDEQDIEAFVGRSVDGYAGTGDVREHAFVVRAPEAFWVQRSLPVGGLVVEHRADGSIRVSVKTAALVPIARFVTGLGEAARSETPDLSALVRRIAEGALGGRARSRKVNAGAAAANEEGPSAEGRDGNGRRANDDGRVRRRDE